MPRLPDPNEMAWETVALPLARGVDVRAPGRAISPQRLLKLENGRFSEGDVGIERRRGHKQYRVRRETNIIGTVAPSESFQTAILGVSSASPEPGRLEGLARRDDEVLAWDGSQLFSWPGDAQDGDGWHVPYPAAMPHARTSPIAKEISAQVQADVGIGNGIAVVACLTTSNMSVYDSVTWAPRLVNHRIAGGVPLQVRVVPCGDWVHVLLSDATTLSMYSVHKGSPYTVRTGLTNLGDCNTYFDVKQIDDTLWAVVKRSVTNVASLTYLNADGTVNTTYCSANKVLDTSPNDGDQEVVRVAFNVHPTTRDVCLVWEGAGTTRMFAKVYTSGGTSPGTRIDTAGAGSAGLKQLTVAPEYALSAGASVFRAFYAVPSSGGVMPFVQGIGVTRTAGSTDARKRWAVLASHAFRVGQDVFVLARSAYHTGQTSKLQVSYFLCDVALKPVGILERGTGTEQLMSGLPSVHADYGQAEIDRANFHGLIVRRERLDSANNDQYDEESLKLVRYDFVPPLRSAQLGRCTYFAGAQLHAYDGNEVVEAGFHQTAENVIINAGAAGNLTGNYQYRFRPAYKNAQGEEIIGPAITTPVASSPTVAAKKMNCVWPSLQFTRRTNAYWLIYRREATGTQWYLVSSRDPAVSGDNGFITNTLSSDTLTFTDNLSDASIISREKDRLDAGLLEPFSPPASEVVAAGRDRLWLAGGEIPTGDILPSLLYSAGSGVEFNTFLETTIDRGSEPITGFGFMGLSTFVFRRTAIYAFEADGPNNLTVGSFDTPRLVAADTGALSQASIVLTTQGLVFQSPTGFQMLATNYQVADIGRPVAPRAREADITGTVLAEVDQELRFYARSGEAFVFNYRSGEWSTWTGLACVGAVRNARTGLAILGKSSGSLLVETDGVWTDGGYGYEFVWRTAQLHAGTGLQEFQRIRRIALLGDRHGNHVLHVKVFYDDRDYPQDEWHWNPATDLNESTWGAGTWGAGFWGDVNASATVPLKDSTYVTRHRCKLQKCSRISIEVSDGGADGAGPAFTELALELGRRGGLNRLPARTTTA